MNLTQNARWGNSEETKELWRLRKALLTDSYGDLFLEVISHNRCVYVKLSSVSIVLVVFMF